MSVIFSQVGYTRHILASWVHAQIGMQELAKELDSEYDTFLVEQKYKLPGDGLEACMSPRIHSLHASAFGKASLQVCARSLLA